MALALRPYEMESTTSCAPKPRFTTMPYFVKIWVKVNLGTAP